MAVNTLGTCGAGGNLRDGSNAGSAYLNCRNRLDRTNWNYLACNCHFYCVAFHTRKECSRKAPEQMLKILL